MESEGRYERADGDEPDQEARVERAAEHLHDVAEDLRSVARGLPESTSAGRGEAGASRKAAADLEGVANRVDDIAGALGSAGGFLPGSASPSPDDAGDVSASGGELGGDRGGGENKEIRNDPDAG